MRKLWQTTFASPSVRIFVGLAIGQGVTFVATPILTRLYSPEELGVSGTFIAAASIAGTVATLRFETLIPSSPSEMVPWIVRRALGVMAAVTATAVFGYLIFSGGDTLNAMLFGATVVGIACGALLMQVAARKQFLSGIPSAKATQGLGQTGVQVTCGLASATSIGLQAGIAAGYTLSAVTQVIFLRRSRPREESHHTRRPRKRKLWRQAFVLVLAAFINICTVWMYPLLTQFFFGSDVTGQLTVAQRIGLVPAAMVVASLSPVIVSHVSAVLRDKRPVNSLIRTWLKRLIPLAGTALAFMVLLPESWIQLFLGGEWGLSRDFLAAMGLMVASQLVVGPFSMVLVLQGRASTQLIWDASRLVVLLVVTSVVALTTGRPVAMIWAASVVMTMFYGLYVVLMFRSPDEIEAGT